MNNAVPPIAGLTNWLLFWLKAYICVIALSMLTDVVTHVIPDDFTDNHIARDVVPPMVAHANAAQEEGLETEEDAAFAAEVRDAIADDDLELGLELTPWEKFTLTALIVVGFAMLFVGFAYLGLYMLTGLLFLKWMYRMAAHLRVSGQEHFPYTPLWSVSCFFIPFVNVVAPPRIIQKMWGTVSGSTGTSLVSGWWALVILQYVVNQADSRMLVNAWRREPGMQLVFSNAELLLGLGSDLVHAIVALFTLLLVQQITREYGRNVSGGTAEATG